MRHVLTVRRIGNSLGVVFPKKVVEERGLRERDRVEVDPKPVRGIRHLRGVLRKWGVPSAAKLNRATNEGEEL